MDKKLQYFVDRSKLLKRAGALARHKDFKCVIEATIFLPINSLVLQRIWHLTHNTGSVPLCKMCTQQVTWHKTKKGYNTYCSAKCSKHDPDVIQKTKNTNLERYGVTNPQQNTNIRNKTIQTTLEKYGVPYAVQNTIIAEKIKSTNLERYGVEYTCMAETVKLKRENTCLERYDTKNPFGNSAVQEKIKQTNMERYGASNFNKKHIPSVVLSLLYDKEWLQDQHIIQQKTLIQMSDELQVHANTIGRYMHYHNIDVQLYHSGYICEHYFNNNPQKRLLSVYLYVVLLQNDDEQFVKIGITTGTLQQRFYAIPYNVNTIMKLQTTLYTAYTTEQHILGTIDRTFKYTPLISFSGRTECLSVSALEFIIDEVTNVI